MFNTLASYLLGNSNRNTDQANNNNNNNTIVSELDEVEILPDKINITTTSCDEDDWLFVDKEDEEGSLPRTDSEEESPVVVIKNSPLVRNRPSTVNDELLYAASSPPTTTISLPATISMEESWFVTPPPCFTSTGPIHMETSPFEDLLIEHPSMSVYLSLRSSNPFDFEDDIIVVDIPEQEPIQQQIAERRTNHVGHATNVPRAPRNDQLAQQQKKQLMIIRNIQKNHEHQKRQTMCRNVIERTNKVREVNTKGGRQKRCDKSHCKAASRANNNRKC